MLTQLGCYLQNLWYRNTKNYLVFTLLPFSWIYRCIVRLRRWYYQKKNIKKYNVPVVVVGNLTVGGSGKTPLVIFLVEQLKQQGYRPGVITRGYKGNARLWPQWVDAHSCAKQVGDEAVLIARRTHVPVIAGPDRNVSIEKLLNTSDCNLVISDDGLQHYALHRHIEIVVIDQKRGFGNRCLLPAGPLREPISRLKSVDVIVENQAMSDQQLSAIDINRFDRSIGNKTSDTFCRDIIQLLKQPSDFSSAVRQYRVQQRPHRLVNLNDSQRLFNFTPGQTIHAVAGIAHPLRFFDMLSRLDFDVIAHPFPDHYHYRPVDLEFTDSYPVIMTEKDAVKCAKWAADHYWYLPIDLVLLD